MLAHGEYLRELVLSGGMSEALAFELGQWREAMLCLSALQRLIVVRWMRDSRVVTVEDLELRQKVGVLLHTQGDVLGEYEAIREALRLAGKGGEDGGESEGSGKNVIADGGSL